MSDEESVELCPPMLACPGCGQRAMDELIWTADHDLHCVSCGLVYGADPPQVKDWTPGLPDFGF